MCMKVTFIYMDAYSYRRGFTLIELLVVIANKGVLSKRNRVVYFFV